MIVILDHVTLNKDEEDSKGTVMKIEEGIEQDIKELLRYDLQMEYSHGF